MGDVLSSLREQLAEAQENLGLIQVRKSEYVQATEVPLQLVKDEQRLEAQIADLQARLARLIETPCPYRGLEPFEAEHAAFYFGREEMVKRLVAKVKESAFVAVVGPSGCGKSSLVRAGLVTALRQGAWPGSQEWAVRFFRPGSDPLRALAMPLVTLLEPEATTEVTRLAEARQLAEHLRDKTLPLADVAARLREKQPTLSRLVLIADQFEELYTECLGEDLRQTFIEALLAAAGQGITIVLALRADFYGHALANLQLGQAIGAGPVNVLPMSKQELREAIERPALQTGRDFEPGLVNKILEDVAEQPGNLPLLEFALTELWQHQTAEGALTHAAYDAIGRVAEAIGQTAEREYGKLVAQGQGDLVRRVFLRLVRPGEEMKDTRQKATLPELAARPEDEVVVHTVVAALADARLVTTGLDEATKQATVEVAHEALVRGWPRLLEWVNQDRAFLLWRQRLRATLREWERLGHDEGALLRGAPLGEAEHWLAERGGDLNPGECAFIQASVAAREQERQRELEQERRLRQEAEARQQAEAQRATAQAQAATRLRWLAIGLAAFALIAATFAFFAVLQRNTAERQTLIANSREMSALAAAKLDVNAECSLILAIEAYNLGREIPDMHMRAAGDLLRQALLKSRVRATLTGHSNMVNSIAWGPDGRWLASASALDGTVRLWNANTGENTVTLSRTSPSVVVWSADGRQLAIGSPKGTIELWSVEAKESITIPTGHTDPVESVAWSPDGRQLASASQDHTVRVWNVEARQNVVTMTGHTDRVNDVAWSPDGQEIASASHDKTVRLWNAKTGENTAVLVGHTSQVLAVAFSPDGQQLASGADDGTVRLWDVKTGKSVATLRRHTNQVYDVAWSPNGRQLASASWDSTVRLWDVETKENITTLTGHTSGVRSVAWSPDGQQLASASDDGTVRLWDVAKEKGVLTLRGHIGWVWGAAWSPDGRKLASASDDNTVRLWDAMTGEQIATLRGHTNQVTSVTWSPDGQQLASASGDETVRLWDVGAGKNTVTLIDHTDRLWAVVWSPDGQQLASASLDGTVRLWDARSGKSILVLSGISPTSVAWSPNGKQLAFTSTRDGSILLWDLKTNKISATLTGHASGGIWGLAWSPDGRQLASASDDGTVRLWDVQGGKNTAILSGHTLGVKGVAWSPDGRQLASSSLDNTVKLWDTKTGENIATLTGHTSGVRTVAWSPDGRRLASASEDGTIRVFYTNIEDVLAVAQQQAAHGLTPREQLICLGKPPPTATPAPTPTFGPTPTPAPTPTLSAEDHINQGRKYAEAGQYDLAMDEFTEAIALTTDDASIYTEACFIGTMNDMAKMVLPICDRAVEIAANEATAHFTRGIAYLESGDDKQAIISFNRAIELDSTFALAYGMRAATQIKQITETSDPEQDIGSLEQAIRDLEMYLMLEPNAPDKDDVEKIIGAMKSLVEKLKK